MSWLVYLGMCALRLIRERQSNTVGSFLCVVLYPCMYVGTWTECDAVHPSGSLCSSLYSICSFRSFASIVLGSRLSKLSLIDALEKILGRCI